MTWNRSLICCSGCVLMAWVAGCDTMSMNPTGTGNSSARLDRLAGTWTWRDWYGGDVYPDVKLNFDADGNPVSVQVTRGADYRPLNQPSVVVYPNGVETQSYATTDSFGTTRGLGTITLTIDDKKANRVVYFTMTWTERVVSPGGSSSSPVTVQSYSNYVIPNTSLYANVKTIEWNYYGGGGRIHWDKVN